MAISSTAYPALPQRFQSAIGAVPTSYPTSTPTLAPTSSITPAGGCSQYSSCNACPEENCCWDESQNQCLLSSSQSCEDERSDFGGNCDPEKLSMVTFAASAGALAFFCLCSYLTRHFRTRHPSTWNGSESLRAPLRQDVVMRDTMVEMGHAEWECGVCGFLNSPSLDKCSMCGTTKELQAENIRGNRDRDQDHSVTFLDDKAYTEGERATQRSSSTISGSLLSLSKRQRSFSIRRMNKLNLNQRQKGARRRRQWIRRLGPDSKLRWERSGNKYSLTSTDDSNENRPQDAEYDGSDSSEHVMDMDGMDAMNKQSPHGRGGDGGRYSRKMNDTFGDAAMLSTSPGFISQFLDDGTATWTPADQTEVGEAGDGGLGAVDWEAVAALPYKEKWKWFIEQMGALQQPWEEGHVRLKIDRKQLLQNSLEQFGELPIDHLHRWLRVEFEGEPAIDAGGLEREWFQLCVEEVFSSEQGLFESTHATEAVSYMVSPGCDLMGHYRFTGRLMGKALMEQQLISAHLALPLLKHILGVPITISDLEFVDGQLYQSLVWMKQNQNVEALCLDFTVTRHHQNETLVHELKEGGADIDVTDENKHEYIQLLFKYRMLDSIREQLRNLLEGFFEVLPRELISVFDYQELEMLMCGLPDINVDNWKLYTTYEGEFESKGADHPVCMWFWELVVGFTQEDRARLLQFATGTSRVPASGFKALQSNDGHARSFTLRSVTKDISIYPRSHTCFNRIDLPLYSSKQEMEAYMTLVINMEVTGFTME